MRAIGFFVERPAFSPITPAIAEVYLFTVDGKVFMICAHGEGDIPTKSQAFLPALLATIKKAEP